MKIPKVSVIIPNYNHARYLEKRIQSVLDQTYQDFEIIYLDDASTDKSDQVFAKFENDARIRAVLNTRNSGTPFIQWNKGVREARGEYVWLAEADDFADPRLLETLVGMLDENPGVSVAYCKSWVVDTSDKKLHQTPAAPAKTGGISTRHAADTDRGNGTETGTKNDALPATGASPARWERWDELPWNRDFICDGRQFYRHYMIYENLIPNASAAVFRRAAYEAAGGADESMRVCGDYIAWIGLLKQGDVAFSAQTLNFFRMHVQSVRSTSNKSGIWAFERFRVASTILKDLTLSPDEIDRLCHIRMGHWLDDVFSSTRRTSWKYSVKILGVAREMDPKFGLRLAWQIAYYWVRRAPGFTFLRALSRRLLWRTRANA